MTWCHFSMLSYNAVLVLLLEARVAPDGWRPEGQSRLRLWEPWSPGPQNGAQMGTKWILRFLPALMLNSLTSDSPADTCVCSVIGILKQPFTLWLEWVIWGERCLESSSPGEGRSLAFCGVATWPRTSQNSHTILSLSYWAKSLGNKSYMDSSWAH